MSVVPILIRPHLVPFFFKEEDEKNMLMAKQSKKQKGSNCT